MNEKELESTLQAEGLNAPRVTPDRLDAVIVSEHYFTAAEAQRMVVAGGAKIPHGLSESETNPEALSLLTFCVLVCATASPSLANQPAQAPKTLMYKWGEI